MSTHKKIKKIDDKSVPNPVNQIADGTTSDQGQSHCIKAADTTETPLSQPNKDQRRRSCAYKKGLTPQGGLTCQHAEGSPIISDIGQIEKT